MSGTMSDVNKFWDLLESKMGCSIPKYLQNILAMRGYENAVSISMMTVEDIKELQSYVKTDEMKERVPDNA